MMRLIVVLNDAIVGVCEMDAAGRQHFAYVPEWSGRADAIPVSLSLPLDATTHEPELVSAVLWGLLPDNEHVLQRWATHFQVSARNPLALLSHVGEDCAGALQFVRENRLARVISGENDAVDWLDQANVARRLRSLRRDASASRRPEDLGQFSLAGAQAKTALLFENGRWGVPSGRIPTTHILKPPSGEYDGYAENEHFCLRLAAELGLPVCNSEILRFEDQVAICVERYDRVHRNGRWWRVHQEDMCQALGVPPQKKYQNHGGPGVDDIAGLLFEHSGNIEKDAANFFLSLVFNGLIAGTDAHAKNYSMLLGGGGDARLAPLYDLSSALPYRNRLPHRKLKMAMRIGGRYRWWEIRPSDWKTVGEALDFSEDEVRGFVTGMATVLPEMASQVARYMTAQGAGHRVLACLVDEIVASCARVQSRFDAR
jgi:serine/threonine-protein kinase HipA